MSLCKGCGKPVLFARDSTGTMQILDPRAPVYLYEEVDGKFVCTRTTVAAVSHFSTCPKASEFSKKKKG